MRKIMQLQKNDKEYLCVLIIDNSQTGTPEIAVSNPPNCDVQFSQDMACQTLRLCVFWEALRHICVTAGA